VSFSQKGKIMKNGNILLKGNKMIAASVPVLFFRLKNSERVFAECPALGISTSGNTLSHAKKMFEEVFSLWVDTIHDGDYDMAEALKSLGWEITANAAIPKEEVYKVPMEILCSKSKNILIPAGA
jgi:hypothetical protein